MENNAGDTVVALLANNLSNGVVGTRTAEGKQLVMLNSEGDMGGVYTYQPSGNKLVRMSVSDNGGVINVYNKTGKAIADLKADEYGNGVVGVYWNCHDLVDNSLPQSEAASKASGPKPPR